MMKTYVLLLDWWDNDDPGREILMITTDYKKVRDRFEQEVKDLYDSHPDWIIMDNTFERFFSHSTYPDHLDLQILTYTKEN